MSKTIVEVEMLPSGNWEVTQVDVDEKFGYRFDERVLDQFATRLVYVRRIKKLDKKKWRCEMADVKTIETKRKTIKADFEYGNYRPNRSRWSRSKARPYKGSVKANINMNDKKITSLSVQLESCGTALFRDVDELIAFRNALSDVIKEVE